ncbi:MAG: epoxyqueuosine reductase [Coriobacteriales bacterium]
MYTEDSICAVDDRAKVLSDKIRMKALELGFAACGFAPLEDMPEYAAEIASRPDYERMTNPDDPGSLYSNCFPSKYYPQGKSSVSVAFAFNDIDFPENLTESIGRCYLARCYTPQKGNINYDRIELLKQYIESLGIDVYRDLKGPYCIPERMSAARAGITTYGDNNFARTEENGTFIILYTILVDAVLDYDEPTVENPCPEGCTLCIDACPTHAILKPGRLHSKRCILYLNTSGGIAPEELRGKMGVHIHGCDVCQMVCPRNAKPLKVPKHKDLFLEEISKRFDLERLLFLDDEYYDEVVYPVMYNYVPRDKMWYFRRNAAIALGNTGDTSHLPALEKAAREDENEYVREAARWAIGNLQG